MTGFFRKKLYQDMSPSERQRFVTEFVNAAGVNGSLDVLKRCIDRGVDVEAQKNDSYRAIHAASHYGRLRIVQYLVTEYRVDVMATIESGHTAMHIASWKGHLDVLRYFIEHCQVDANLKINDTWTALHIASQFGHLDIVKYFIEDCRIDATAKGNKGWTVLHNASFNGHLQIVKYLVENCGVDTTTTTDLGLTARRLARDFGKTKVADYLKLKQPESVRLYKNMTRVEREQLVKQFFDASGFYESLDIVTECVNKGVDVETQKSNTWRAVHLSSYYGHLTIVKYLVEHCQASVVAAITDGSNALHLASGNGHLPVVRYLLQDCQVDVTTKTNDGWTALHLASGKGHLDVVRYFIEDNHFDVVTTKNNNGTSALHNACLNGHLEVVRYFIEDCKVDVATTKNNDGWTGLHDACFNGHLKVVKYLVEDCDVDVTTKISKGQTALHIASEQGHLNIVKYLVDDCGADISARTNLGRTACSLARDLGKDDVVDYLTYRPAADVTLFENMSPTEREEFVTEFVNAAGIHGNLDKVKEYFYRGVNVDAQKNDSFGAIHTSSFNGHLEIIMYLVEQCHVDITAKNKDGVTALHLASANGHLDIVRYLVGTCHMDVTMIDHDGWTVFHFASANGCLDILRYLIVDCQVDLTSKSNDEWTVLHMACANGHVDIVKYLVEECGLDIDIRTKMDNTACDVAREFGKNDIADYLMKLPETKHGQVKPELPSLALTVFDDKNMHNEMDISTDRKRMEIMKNEPAANPTALSFMYLKMCTDDFTSKVVSQGSSGKVYFGCDKEIGIKIVVKRINLKIPDQEAMDKIILRIKQEIAVIKRFRHPNIEIFYGYNVLAKQRSQFLVYEYLPNGSLATFWNDEKSRTRLPSQVRLSIMFQLARSMHFLHSGGCNNIAVFHRDIKSGNICLTDEYAPKLIDFGLAKLVHEHTGVVMGKSIGAAVYGTPGYICPVYSRGQSPYTAACDVFSIGVVFAELIVGSLQSGRSSNDGQRLGDFFARYIKDDDDEPVRNGWKILKRDADKLAQWSDDTLERLCKIAVECMATSPKHRISTNALVQGLSEISSQDFTSRCNSGNKGVALYSVSNLTNLGRKLEKKKDAENVRPSYQKCVLCNRSTCSNVKCIDGHRTCAQCIEHEIQFRMGDSGNQARCKCGLVIDDDALSAKISTATYNGYIQQRSQQRVTEEKMIDEFKSPESATSNISERNHDEVMVSLKGIKSNIQRVLEGLAYVTVNSVQQCPTIVWLVPADRSAGKTAKDWKKWAKNGTEKKYDLYFVCQHSFEVVETKITIAVTRFWLAQVAPVLVLSMFLLRKAATIGGLPPLPFPISTLSRVDQISLNEEFVMDLLDPWTFELLETFKATFAQGSDLPYSVSSRLSSLTEKSYEGIVLQAASLKQCHWKHSMEPVTNPRGSIIWIKNDYRDFY